MTRATLIELPPALCLNNAPTLAALVARDDASTASARLYLGKTLDLGGGEATSFSLLQTLPMAAWHGIFTADYGADTLYIDLERGAGIQLDGPDLVLEETTPFDALADVVMIFAGREIMSLAGWDLTGAGQYKLRIVRGRFGTAVQSHPAGEEVFIIRQVDLRPMNLPTLLPGNIGQFKLVRGVDNLDDQDISSFAFSGGALKLPPPSMITVNGMAVPLVDTGSNLEIAWKLPVAGLLGKRVSTLVEFVVPGEDVVSVSVDWETATLSQAWAGLPAAATDGFTLRLSTQIDEGDAVVQGATTQLFVTVVGGAGGGSAAVITGIMPAYAPTSTTPTDIHVYGTGFTNDGSSDLIYNSESAVGWVFVDSTHLIIPGVNSAAGSYPIFFHNAFGDSNTANFIAY